MKRKVLQRLLCLLDYLLLLAQMIKEFQQKVREMQTQTNIKTRLNAYFH